MARSVRSKERVNYVALDNLSSGHFEQVSTGKRNNKPGSTLYQVERLVSKRKSSAGNVGCDVTIKFIPVSQPFCLHLKWYYDENRIFPIEAILKHKQVVYMRRKIPFTFFKYLFSFQRYSSF